MRNFVVFEGAFRYTQTLYWCVKFCYKVVDVISWMHSNMISKAKKFWRSKHHSKAYTPSLSLYGIHPPFLLLYGLHHLPLYRTLSAFCPTRWLPFLWEGFPLRISRVLVVTTNYPTTIAQTSSHPARKYCFVVLSKYLLW